MTFIHLRHGGLQYGEEAVKEGGGGPGAGGMQDIFDMFTGGGGRRQPRERRGENVVHRLKVSLEEVYNGGTRCAHVSNVPLCWLPCPFNALLTNG